LTETCVRWHLSELFRRSASEYALAGAQRLRRAVMTAWQFSESLMRSRKRVGRKRRVPENDENATAPMREQASMA